MQAKLAQKMKHDPYIAGAMAEKQKAAYKTFFLFTAVVWVFCILLCLLAQFDGVAWAATLLLAAALSMALFWLLCRRKQTPAIFLGTVTRMEESRKSVPAKGSGAFGRLPSYQHETYDLLVAVQSEAGETRVIMCAPEYEKLIARGDTLLLHPHLPYPANLSNPTTCLCMHCGTTQGTDRDRCSGCGANLYHVRTVQEENGG